MLRLLLVFLLLAYFASAEAQYERYPVRTQFAMTIGTSILAGGGWLIEHQVKPFQISEIEMLREREFGRLDQWCIHPIDQQSAKASDILLGGSALLPLVALPWIKKEHLGSTVNMYFQTSFLNYFLTSSIKGITQRARPYVYSLNTPTHDLLHREARLGFFSGHTSTSASYSFLGAMLIQEYCDNPTVRTIAWIVASTLPAITGYLRMRAGKHFFTDVLVGYTVGAMVGIGIPLFHRNVEHKN